jgi:hypothetical protein
MYPYMLTCTGYYRNKVSLQHWITSYNIYRVLLLTISRLFYVGLLIDFLLEYNRYQERYTRGSNLLQVYAGCILSTWYTKPHVLHITWENTMDGKSNRLYSYINVRL